MADSPSKTTMRITDVQQDPKTGALTIAVIATRAGINYKLPYQVQQDQIPQVDTEYLKARVLKDVDGREASAGNEAAVIDKLLRRKGKTIKLD